MKSSILRELLLYRYRYIIGYALYAVLLLTLLTVALNSIPRVLSAAEMQSAGHAATITIDSLLRDNIVDAPYLVLQKISLSVFGVTELAIKLPSTVLAMATGLGLALMLRRWFKINVAVLTGIIITTSSSFLVMGRTGTALIMATFWLTLILLGATRVLHDTKYKTVWKTVTFVSVALSLYTPLMIYPLLALGVAGLLHPHVRFIVRRSSSIKIVATIFISLILVAPLAFSVFNNPTQLLTLIGIPQPFPNLAELWPSLKIVVKSLFGFGSITYGDLILPLFGAGTISLVLLGLLKTIVDRHSARSYMLLLWSVLIIPIIIINPSTLITVFMPAVLYLAIGIETLIREWYRLFPRNPYARVAALIPLTILLGSISTGNIGRYFYGYQYGTSSSQVITGLPAIKNALALSPLKDRPIQLVVPSNQVKFFDLLRRDYKSLNVGTKVINPSQATIISQSVYQTLPQNIKTTLGVPYRLITNDASENSLHLRVYLPNTTE